MKKIERGAHPVSKATKAKDAKAKTVETSEMLESISSALPYSDEAEKAVLSGILQEPEERLIECRSELLPEAFHCEPNRIVYATCLGMMDANPRVPIDIVTVSKMLRDQGLIDRVGGASALSELYTYAPITTAYTFYVTQVRDQWLLRAGIRAHAQGIQDLQAVSSKGADADVRGTIMDTEARIFELVEKSQAAAHKGPVHSNVVVNEVIDHVLKLQESKGKMLGVSTGWPDLDRAIGSQGLEPPDVFVCGARPKMGKTNVLCSMVKAIAVDQGHPTLVLSLEMTRRRMWNRIMFGGFDIETSKASTGFLDKPRDGPADGDDDGDLQPSGNMSRGDQENLARSQRAMGKAPLWVDDTPQDTNTLRATIRLWVRRDAAPYVAAHPGKKIVIGIDYLQLVEACTAIGKSEERHTIAECMKTIHALAKELKLIFICLAQVNRSAETNPRHEPSTKDYDGGSAIEKFLDYGSFIHRPSRYKRWEDLDEKAQAAFKAQIIERRKKNPDMWSPPQVVRNGLGHKVRDENGREMYEWDPAMDWAEHALLLLPLNRNGDDARIWLRFRKEFTRFDSRTPVMWSNNPLNRQVGYADKFAAPESQPSDEDQTLFAEH